MSAREDRLSRAVVESLILPTEPWLSCDECFDLMDEFADAVVGGTEPPRRAAMEVHLGACPACSEEVGSLVELLREDAGSS